MESDARVRLPQLVLFLGLPVSLLEPLSAQDWAARFPPAAPCHPQLHPSAVLDSTLLIVGRARLIVIPHVLGEAASVSHVQARLAPLAHPLELTPLSGGQDTAFRVVEADAAGAHVLYVAGIGFGKLVDTVYPRIGYSDTLVVWLRQFDDEYRNTYNCRPRGFRQPGESACVTDSAETAVVLARAREFAVQGSLKSLGIAPFDSSRVSLIRDENTCRRAAKLYGEPNDPPRRVVVVRMGKHFLVYDPYEPLPAGEWDLWRIFDRRWKPVFDLMG